MLTSHEINQARLERHLIIWLLLRPGWLMYTTSRSSVIPSVMPQTQHWKSYFVQLSRKLGFEKSISSAPSSSAASNTFASNDPSTQTARGRPEKKQKVQKARPGTTVDELESMFDFNVSTEPVDVYWDGDLVKTRSMLDQGDFTLSAVTFRQVVWDLYEQNFRLELLALDRSIFPRGKMSGEQGSVRDNLLLDVFPDASYIFHRLPSKDQGLGAKDWLARISYVEAFRKFMSDWPSSPSSTVGYISDSLASAADGEQRLLTCECTLFSFYCQTFFLYFGRAPSVPHHLP